MFTLEHNRVWWRQGHGCVTISGLNWLKSYPDTGVGASFRCCFGFCNFFLMLFLLFCGSLGGGGLTSPAREVGGSSILEGGGGAWAWILERAPC